MCNFSLVEWAHGLFSFFPEDTMAYIRNSFTGELKNMLRMIGGRNDEVVNVEIQGNADNRNV